MTFFRKSGSGSVQPVRQNVEAQFCACMQTRDHMSEEPAGCVTHRQIHADREINEPPAEYDFIDGDGGSVGRVWDDSRRGLWGSQ